MGAKAESQASPNLTVIGRESERERGAWKHVGGSRSDDWNTRIVNETVQALSVGNGDDAMRDQQFHAAINALIGIAPQDEVEGMMAAQLLAAHGATMECFRRATESNHDYARGNDLGAAIRLSRGFAVLLAALGRYRSMSSPKGAAGPAAAGTAPEG